jgi:uncharacterized protein with PIN domain
MSKSKTNSHATTAPKVKTGQILATKNVPKIITVRNITDSLDYCDHLLINISREEVKTRVPTETVKTLYMLYSTPEIRVTFVTGLAYLFPVMIMMAAICAELMR